MEWLNKEEHLSCYLYDNQGDSVIVHFDKTKGETFLLNEPCSQIVFLLKGKISFSNEYQVHNIFEEGTFLMFPMRHKYIMNVVENLDIVIINMHSEINFYNHFPFEISHELNESIASENPAYSLKTNEMRKKLLLLLACILVNLSGIFSQTPDIRFKREI